MGFPRQVASALRASVARPDHRGPGITEVIESAGPEDLARLAEAAHFHGVAGYVHAAVQDDERVPERVRAELRALRDRTVLAHLLTLGDLSLLRETFDGAGIEWMVIKGPVLAQPVHGATELRAYTDLDVVVPAGSLETAMEALEAAGGSVLDRNWTLLERDVKGEVHVELPSGTPLDLHWHLLNDRSRRQAFPIDVDALFDRQVRVDVGGLKVPTLGPADTVVYVALHAVLSGAHRLVWLKDVERLVDAEDLALPEVARRAHEWQAELALAAAVSCSRRTLGIAPQAIPLTRPGRAPRPWSAAGEMAWRLAPAERQDGGGSLSRIVARSARHGQWSSLLELMRRMRRHLLSRQREDDRDERGRFEATDPRSGRYESGGAPARRAYLQAVVRETGRFG